MVGALWKRVDDGAVRKSRADAVTGRPFSVKECRRTSSHRIIGS
jgi:hypothetical protein